MPKPGSFNVGTTSQSGYVRATCDDCQYERRVSLKARRRNNLDQVFTDASEHVTVTGHRVRITNTRETIIEPTGESDI